MPGFRFSVLTASIGALTNSKAGRRRETRRSACPSVCGYSRKLFASCASPTKNVEIDASIQS